MMRFVKSRTQKFSDWFDDIQQARKLQATLDGCNPKLRLTELLHCPRVTSAQVSGVGCTAKVQSVDIVALISYALKGRLVL